jgi:hypothetical protein
MKTPALSGAVAPVIAVGAFFAYKCLAAKLFRQEVVRAAVDSAA